METVVDAMEASARAGGAVAVRHFRRGVDVTLKADRSPVSVADRECEQAVVTALAAAFPDHGVLGEESGAQGPTARRFIVDAIDGTRNFVRGIPFWAVLVALEEGGVGRLRAPGRGEPDAAGLRRLPLLRLAGVTPGWRPGAWRSRSG